MRLIDADALWMEVIHTLDYCDDILEIIERQKTIEPTHLNDSNTLKALDCIGRQEAIDAMYALVDGCVCDDEWKENPHIDAIVDTLENLPSAQPEITLESAIDYLHKIGWMQEHDRVLTEPYKKGEQE